MRTIFEWLRRALRAPHREESSLSEPLLPGGAPLESAGAGKSTRTPWRRNTRSRFQVREINESCEAAVTLYVGDKSVVIARREGAEEIPFVAVDAWATSRRVCVLCPRATMPRCFLFATLEECVRFHQELWKRAPPSDIYAHTGTLCTRAPAQA